MYHLLPLRSREPSSLNMSSWLNFCFIFLESANFDCQLFFTISLIKIYQFSPLSTLNTSVQSYFLQTEISGLDNSAISYYFETQISVLFTLPFEKCLKSCFNKILLKAGDDLNRNKMEERGYIVLPSMVFLLLESKLNKMLSKARDNYWLLIGYYFLTGSYINYKLQPMRRAVSKYLQQIFAVNMPGQSLMQEIYEEITNGLNKAYLYPEMQQYLKSLPVNSLLAKSVEYFVGSKSTPRNELIMRMLLDQAKVTAEKRENDKEIGLVKYYFAYYVKMGAIKDGNEVEYDRSNNMFMELAEKGDYLSNYMVGKETYKMVESGEMGSWKDNAIVKKANEVFINSLCDQQYGGMFYIADIDERHRGQPTTAINNNKLEDVSDDDDRSRMLFELYCQSASLGYRLSYFKIALKFKKQKKYKLYKKYLIKAAEDGVIEAQHNLGLEYTNGQHFPKDELKGLAWFLQAAAHGFVYSKYNLSRMLAQGTTCGRVKPNKKASLVYLQQINRSGELDVSKQIAELVAAIQK